MICKQQAWGAQAGADNKQGSKRTIEARERKEGFPPQKAVIGINYLTGANSDESHN